MTETLTTPRWLRNHDYREDIDLPPPNWFRTVVVGRDVIRFAARVGESVDDVEKREWRLGVLDD